MNLETRNFVTSLLNKYNCFQNIVDIDTTISDNTFVLGEVGGETIELEADALFRIIQELCEALNITTDTKEK
ncbi:hypothetical protein S14_41 [Shewanella sp. phage 1/4]|uniref:hypothetical protein n=1 Tax=Shewanella phage 1/4 TaxID=1458859 RepID=UPI0004F63A41|nr:hypothetical protein S14_41 [Shewanella sp. phage 1/4]AHK11153.1 hypothetical protein S14_41 [Shewanella sp. phage 1/4]